MICYTPEGLLADAPSVQALAQSEGLWAHALSVGLRRRLAEGGELSVDDVSRVAWPEDLPAPSGVKLPGFGGRS